MGRKWAPVASTHTLRSAILSIPARAHLQRVLSSKEVGVGRPRPGKMVHGEARGLGGGEEGVKDPGLALLSLSLGGEAAEREGSELGSGPPRFPPDSRRLGPAGRPFWHTPWGRRSRTLQTHTPLSSLARPLSSFFTKRSLAPFLSLSNTHAHSQLFTLGSSPARRSPGTHLLRGALRAPLGRAPCALGPDRRSYRGPRAPG